MGEVDQKPFQDVCLQRFSGEDWEVRAVEQSSLWQEKVKDPGWQPFKKMTKDGKLQVLFNLCFSYLKHRALPGFFFLILFFCCPTLR